MKAFVAICFALFCGSSIARTHFSGSSGTGGGANINNMFFLGTVEGKSYFADNTANRTWSSSEGYCRASGMRLASVDTVGQMNFLKGKSNSTNFGTVFWTAGADAADKYQFKWYTTGKVTNETFIDIGSGGSRLQCLLFDATDGHLHFHIRLCTETHYTLCETPPAYH